MSALIPLVPSLPVIMVKSTLTGIVLSAINLAKPPDILKSTYDRWKFTWAIPTATEWVGTIRKDMLPLLYGIEQLSWFPVEERTKVPDLDERTETCALLPFAESLGTNTAASCLYLLLEIRSRARDTESMFPWRSGWSRHGEFVKVVTVCIEEIRVLNEVCTRSC